jgi:glucose/mannose-6-phosphate isomerase
MFNEIKNFPIQVSDAINDTKDLSLNLDKIHRIVIMGMGGSAIAGSIMKDISPHLEIIVERNYFPNAIIDEHTLLIISSYSGNTEETLSYYRHASSFTKNIFGITSGGELLESLKKDNHDFHILPKGYPPRSILGYTLAVLVKLLDEDELLELLNIELLQEYSDKFSLESSEIFALAKKTHSTFPVIITEEDLSSSWISFKESIE